MENVEDRINRGAKLTPLISVFCLFTLILVLLFQTSPSCFAAEIEDLKIPLTKIFPFPKADFKGARANLTVKLPIPIRWRIHKASLHLSYVNSSALLPERSRLVVFLNGYALTQITLQPHSPEGQVDIPLPPELLLPDYNDLDFFVYQNYTEKCSDPDAPELWTSLKPADSYLEIDYSRFDVPLSLASIPNFIFDPKKMNNNRVHLVVENNNEDNLRLAALAAAGTAIRYQYQPVSFSLSREIQPGQDNIVIGNRGFVTELLARGGLTLPDGNLGVMHLPAGKEAVDAGHALIVLTGEALKEIETAAQAFSVISYPLPAGQFTTVREVLLPEITRYSGKMLLSPDGEYLFRDLGFKAATRRGFRPAPINLAFRLPADFLIKTNESLVLSLHLAYGAAMRKDSVLNIYLNDGFAGAVPLDDPRGERYQAYQINVPNILLKKGYNSLTFSPVLTPTETGECRFFQTENLVLTLFDDSRIQLPAMDHWVEMPQIGLFYQDGFPLAKMPDWREAMVFLTGKDNDTIAAALNLVAMICQKNGIGPYGIGFTYNVPQEKDTDILTVGPFEALPKSLAEASPFSPETAYPFNGELPAKRTDRTWLTRWIPETTPPESSKIADAKVVHDTILGPGKLLITEFESPWAEARTVLAVTAETPETLLEGALALWDPGLQGKAHGDLVIVDLNSPGLETYTHKAGPAYFIGKIGKIGLLDHLLHTYPLFFLIALVLCLILMAWIIRLLLKGYKRKRIAKESKSPADA